MTELSWTLDLLPTIILFISALATVLYHIDEPFFKVTSPMTLAPSAMNTESCIVGDFILISFRNSVLSISVF